MNPEPLLVSWLRARYTTTDVKRVSTERPADLTGNLPYVQVVGIGGQDEAMAWGGSPAGFARRNVDLDVYAAGRDAARDLAERIHTDLLDALPGSVVDGVLVITTGSILTPMWTADDNTNVRRFTFAVSLRLQDRS